MMTDEDYTGPPLQEGSFKATKQELLPVVIR
jgi:hypothetical protein